MLVSRALPLLALCLPLACGGGGPADAEASGPGLTASAGPTATDTASGSETEQDASQSGSVGPGTGAESDPSADTEAVDVVDVRIEPAMPFLEVIDGVVPDPIDLRAIGTTAEGEEVEVNGVWNVDRLDVAGVDASSGMFSATGIAGGIVEISFSSGGGETTAAGTIKLHYHDDGGVDETTQGLFGGGTTPDPTLDLLYPYTDTVFPRDLVGPIVQWNGSAATDTFYLHLDSPTFEYEGWFTGADPGRYTFPTAPFDIWAQLTASVVADDIQVELERYDGATVFQPVTSSWHIADAELIGTIYYWEVNNGNVVRLKVGDPAPETFLQKPEGVECVACHSLSADGSTMVASFHGGYSPWGTFDAADGASLYATDTTSGFQAISPEGDYVVWGQTSGIANLSTFDDVSVLASLPMTAPGGFPAFPAWSPDGTKLAYTVRFDGDWLDFNNAALWVSDVDLVSPGFANDHELVAPTAARTAVTYPTWSPDSQWVAYGRATQARTRGALGELGLVAADGTQLTALDAACGVGSLTEDQSTACYEPTFMPESRGGYFWLVFVSERTYGNTLTDTNPTTRHKQLWITAIDDPPVPGTDPSHPGFWLSGQELDNQNMRGAWTLTPDDAEG